MRILAFKPLAKWNSKPERIVLHPRCVPRAGLQLACVPYQDLFASIAPGHGKLCAAKSSNVSIILECQDVRQAAVRLGACLTRFSRLDKRRGSIQQQWHTCTAPVQRKLGAELRVAVIRFRASWGGLWSAVLVSRQAAHKSTTTRQAASNNCPHATPANVHSADVHTRVRSSSIYRQYIFVGVGTNCCDCGCEEKCARAPRVAQ